MKQSSIKNKLLKKARTAEKLHLSVADAGGVQAKKLLLKIVFL